MPGVSSKSRVWAGRILSAIAVLFLLFDSAIKLIKIAPVVESFIRLGFVPDLARGIGALELACVLVYLVPRTAVPGAILLTGYLGGAIVTHIRVGDPLFSHVFFPLYVATLIWGGLYLRDGGIGALVGLKPSASPGRGWYDSHQTLPPHQSLTGAPRPCDS